MDCYELGESVQTGFLLHRDPYPHITTPEGSNVTLRLAKEISDTADAVIPRGVTTPLRLDFAEMDLQGPVLLLRPDHRRRQRGRQKMSALVRVHIAAGEGGLVRLLANSFQEVCLGPKTEVGRQYHAFPPAGVHHFCDGDHLKKIREGIELLDVLLFMQPGAGFRIHRTGDLKDQHGVSASPQLAVRWIGHNLMRGGTRVPGLMVRSYDDRIPVLNALPDVLPAAAE